MKSHKGQILKILHLEDNSGDAESIGALLQKNLQCAIRCVKSKSEFEHVISENQFDVILANSNASSLTGSEALQFARNTSPATPFIFVSEAIGEAAAVECIKKGAADFILKDAPEHLIPAISRALADISQRNAESRNGIAHEFNNILLPIVLAAEMLQTDSSAEDRSDWIEIIASSARRGQQIIQRLAKVSKNAEA
jgi:DNA-binding NtrC family response regulator